jgi:hypothetical protein
MKTAVEWLIEKWSIQGTLHSSDISQTKEMEKQQIIDARVNGVIRGIDICDFPTKESLHEEHLKYYNETFKSK